MTSNKKMLERAEEGVCPLCGHWDIVGGFVDIHGNEASQTVCCSVCESEWIEFYKLHDVTVVREGGK